MATVILKPTEGCNARCIYCDVVHKKRRGPVTMPLETLELFFSRVSEFLLERPEETMEVVWHGGEPLLLGPDYFSKALAFQEKHCGENASRVRHSIQSNLTLFTREFAGIFKKMGIFSIGSSYDPVENIRGLGKGRDSRLYNRRFMEAVRLVEDEGLTWGVIYVVTKRSLERPLEIFHFLTNLSPRMSILFNPVLLYDHKLEPLKVTAEEFADFLGAIFPVWWRDRKGYSEIDPFSSLVRNLLENNRSLMCSDSGQCARNHMDLMPDGSLSHCGRSADWGLLDYGSIFEKSFSQVLGDPQREILLQRNTVLPKTECKGCRFWDICHGGCPLDAWSAAGSFLHKSEWCDAKRLFIERYFEPTVHSEPAPVAGSSPGVGSSGEGPGETGEVRTGEVEVTRGSGDGDPKWINPIGGLGDTLMISGVLKHVAEKNPSRKFNLVERTKYRPLLEGHPAIAHIGHPPPGAEFVSTHYWGHEHFQVPGKRAYQILAHMFGLETPVEERLYVPWEFQDDPVLQRLIPWGERNVLICQSSDSPRKQMDTDRWESLVEWLLKDGMRVVQVGKRTDRYVRGAYNLLGLTSPRQLISMVRHFDVVVTSDNFIMHAAHLCGVGAVVLWGPTDHRIYGYSGQKHLQAKIECDYPEGCLGPRHGNFYVKDCPRGAERCMNAIPVQAVLRAVRGLLK